MRGVFDTRPRSAYDDDVAARYHFPSNYRAVVERLLGSWILYREPRREGGRQGYVAAAKVERVEPDRDRPDHAYAIVSNYTEFDKTVPFLRDGRYAEKSLRDLADKTLVGSSLQGRSVREISASDFLDILAEGLGGDVAAEIARQDDDTPPLAERRVDRVLINRKFRDARFRNLVCTAYDHSCALTGLRILSDGNSEAQAAHIWPVSEGGPDLIQNGIALSATVHWLFDRHLISISCDHRVLIARSVPRSLAQLILQNGEAARVPVIASDRPSPAYLARHRSKFMG